MPLDLAYFEFGQTEPRDVQEQIRLLQATLREQEIKNTSLQQQVNGLLLAERHGNETLAQLRAEVQELRQQQQDQTHPPTPPASPPLLSPPLQEQNPEKEPKQEPKQESEQEPKQELKQEVKQEQDLKQEREEREIHAMNTENRTVTRDERLHRALSAGIRRAHARGRGRPHGTGLADLRRPTSNYEWWSIWPWEWHDLVAGGDAQRNRSHVGRIMETAEGVDRDTPCRCCREGGFACKVYAAGSAYETHRKFRKCAHCRFIRATCSD